MKWLVYTLLLVNLGIFLWHFQSSATKPVAVNQVDDQIPQLILLKEYEATEKEKLPVTKDDAAIETCFSLGPFLRKKTFQNVVARFKEAKIPTQKRISKDAVQEGYWVYLPPAKNRKEAQQAMKRLRKKNIHDFFLVVAGEKTNGISLGVFSKPSLAQRQMKKISALGFEVQIDKLSLPKRAYWLEWPKSAEKQPPETLMVSVYERYPGVGRTERACQGKEK